MKTLTESNTEKKRSGSQLRTVLLILGVAVLAACRMPIQLPGEGDTNLTVDIGVPSLSGLSLSEAGSRAITDPLVVQNALVRVTAEDMETIEAVATRDSIETRITRVDLIIPAGRNRRISVAARNANNQVLYRGSTTVDLPRGETRRIAVILEQLTAPRFQAFGLYQGENPDILANRGGVIGSDTVKIPVSETVETDVFVPRFRVPDGATVLANGEEQTSGVTSQDFSSPVEYSVVGPNGGVSIYTVSVQRADADASFTLEGLFDNEGLEVPTTIEPHPELDDVIRVIVPVGTDMTSLAPEFAVADGATVVARYFDPDAGSEEELGGFEQEGGFLDAQSIFIGSAVGGPNGAAILRSGVTGVNFAGSVRFVTTAEDRVTRTTTTAYLYYGDAVPGATGAASTGIYIQNPLESDVVLMDDFSAVSGEFHRKTFGTLGLSGAYDIDYDAFGATYVLGSEGSQRFPDHLSTYTAGGGDYVDVSGRFMAIDRVRDILYATTLSSDVVNSIGDVSGFLTTPSSFAVSSLSMSPADFDIIFGGAGAPIPLHAYGITVDEEGYVYVVVSGVEDTDFTLVKIDPFALEIVSTVDLDPVTEFVTTFNVQHDLLYREGYVYLLGGPDDGETGGAGVLKFTADPLAYTGESIGTLTFDETDTTDGSFLGPQRFAAVLNKKIVIIDEDNSVDDRLVFFDDFSGGTADGWGVYGQHGTADDQFRFFSGS